MSIYKKYYKMKKINKLTWKNKEHEFQANFATYCIFKVGVMMHLFNCKLTKNEIDSALLGLYFEEKELYKNKIKELQLNTANIILKIINIKNE